MRARQWSFTKGERERERPHVSGGKKERGREEGGKEEGIMLCLAACRQLRTCVAKSTGNNKTRLPTNDEENDIQPSKYGASIKQPLPRRVVCVCVYDTHMRTEGESECGTTRTLLRSLPEGGGGGDQANYRGQSRPRPRPVGDRWRSG